MVSTTDQINETIDDVRDVSFREKRDGLNAEQQINKFLDHLLDLQKLLNEKSARIEGIIQHMESLTWLNNLSEKELQAINDLIASARDLYFVLIRQYITLDVVVGKDVTKSVMKRLKSAIDDLKEITSDLESVYFFLPRIPDFLETTKELSLIK